MRRYCFLALSRGEWEVVSFSFEKTSTEMHALRGGTHGPTSKGNCMEFDNRSEVYKLGNPTWNLDGQNPTWNLDGEVEMMKNHETRYNVM